jgi:hypothetical protein
MPQNVFAVPGELACLPHLLPTILITTTVFFICFRECLETSIIVSVLLAFLKQTLGPEHDAAVRKRLVRQVWAGVGCGIFICLVICAGVIGTCKSDVLVYPSRNHLNMSHLRARTLEFWHELLSSFKRLYHKTSLSTSISH